MYIHSDDGSFIIMVAVEMQTTFDIGTSTKILTSMIHVHTVLFRVKIETNRSCDDIRNVLTKWVESGAAAITINFNTLRVNSHCPVEITSPNAPFPDCDRLRFSKH